MFFVESSKILYILQIKDFSCKKEPGKAENRSVHQQHEPGGRNDTGNGRERRKDRAGLRGTIRREQGFHIRKKERSGWLPASDAGNGN
jgi:hypothetical protein